MRKVVTTMNALGLDSFSIVCFQACWDVLKVDIMKYYIFGQLLMFLLQ